MSLNKKDIFKTLELPEIQKKILELKIEILQLKIKKATKQNIKPHIFKYKKHELAQMLTLETIIQSK
uniref:Ribosomal protein L29 n=1 Tax=Inkyuleea mariana TaxID=123988 RepID=A0A4D6X0H0_9FLOR|nr:ribosomal protein L29 [Inkyuleea mariana]